MRRPRGSAHLISTTPEPRAPARDHGGEGIISLRPAGITPPSLDWVLVANGARARLFVRDADNGALREVSDHVHPGSRMKGAELGGERVGQARKSDAATAFTSRETPHEHERAAFAHELAAVLVQGAARVRWE